MGSAGDDDEIDELYRMEFYGKDGSVYLPANFYKQTRPVDDFISLVNSSNFISFSVRDLNKSLFFYVGFNAAHVEVDVVLPMMVTSIPTAHWQRLVDTSQESPLDFVPFDKRIDVKENRYRMASYSSVVMVSEAPRSEFADVSTELKASPVRKDAKKSITAVPAIDKSQIKKSNSTNSFFSFKKFF